jgi:hypothetical protein
VHELYARHRSLGGHEVGDPTEYLCLTVIPQAKVVHAATADRVDRGRLNHDQRGTRYRSRTQVLQVPVCRRAGVGAVGYAGKLHHR